MSVKLVLLGMLKQGPLHGYELKARIEQEMGDWTSIAFGSIYFALRKLTEDNFVRHAGTEQHGGRPSRIIYEITPEGKKVFQRILLKTWSEESRMFFSLDIGLYFMRELEKDKRLELIRGRITVAEYRVKYLQEHQEAEMADPHVPAEAEAIFSHSLYHLEAELAWLREVEKKIEEQVY